MHPPGVYGIPLRSLYSKDVANLFLAGRDASLTHMALCSARVMLTCAQMGEAVGLAAARCHKDSVDPAQLSQASVSRIQQDLLKIDHWIPGFENEDSGDRAREARLCGSSEHGLEMTGAGETHAESLSGAAG